MTFITAALLKLVLPTIAGALAFTVTQFVKHEWAKLDTQPAPVKQAFAAAWALAFNALAESVAVPLCANGAAFCNPPDLAYSAIISYALAVSLHGLKRKG